MHTYKEMEREKRKTLSPSASLVEQSKKSGIQFSVIVRMTGQVMERFTSSSTDEECRSNSRRMSMSILQSTGSLLDTTTSHQPTQQRRQTRQSFVRGRGLGREDSARRHGLLGSIRRMSLDASQLHQLARQCEDRAAISHVLFLCCSCFV